MYIYISCFSAPAVCAMCGACFVRERRRDIVTAAASYCRDIRGRGNIEACLRRPFNRPSLRGLTVNPRHSAIFAADVNPGIASPAVRKWTARSFDSVNFPPGRTLHPSSLPLPPPAYPLPRRGNQDLINPLTPDNPPLGVQYGEN